MNPCRDPQCSGTTRSYKTKTFGASRTQYRKCSTCGGLSKQTLGMDKFGRYLPTVGNSNGCALENVGYDSGKESKP